MPATKDLAVYYHDIVNAMHAAIAVVDDELTVHYVNLGFCELFGVTEADALGRPLFAQHPMLAGDHQLQTLLPSVLMHDVTVDRYRTAFEKAGAPDYALDISARRIKRDGVSIGRALVVVTDATEEQRTMEMKARAIEHSRAQILEINHRVKNNLASILSMLRLERRALTDRTGIAAIDRIALRVKSITSLYELLAVNSDTGSIQLVSYFRSVARLIENLAGAEDLNWAVTVTGNEVLINIDDAINVGAVVSELIGNAANYAFEGLERAGKITIDVSLADNTIRLVVADDGIGITDTDRPSSTGLGMKLVDVYLESLGAQMAREANAGQGTRYTIDIPHRIAAFDLNQSFAPPLPRPGDPPPVTTMDTPAPRRP